MATKAPSTNPLAESMTKVTGLDPLSTTTGTSPITYDDTAGFRAPEGDIITISGDPGTGATTAETWQHEMDLAMAEFEALQFEYGQQQDILSQQLAEQQQALAEQEQALSESQYGLSQQTYGLEAAKNPYEIEGMRLANELAAYDVQKNQWEQEMRDQYYADQWNKYDQRMAPQPTASAQKGLESWGGKYTPYAGQQVGNPYQQGAATPGAYGVATNVFANPRYTSGQWNGQW